MLPVAKILFGCIFMLAVAGAAGRWFLIRISAWTELYRAERALFSLGLGAALLSSVVFAICVAQLVYAPVFAVVGLAILWNGFRAAAPKGQPPPAQDKPAAPLLTAVFLVIAGAYAFLYLSNAVAPEISSDGAGYHLGLVSRYLREHGFSRITNHMYAMLSQGTEMLFLFAFAFGRHSAAKLVHFAFLAGAAGLLLCFARRFQLGAAGAIAAVLFACSPVVGVDGTAAYNDCALAFFTFLTFYLLLLWDQARSPALWPAIGVAAGFCFAIKYTGFLALPVALAFLVLRTRSGRRRGVVTVTACALLFIAPWMIKNAIIVGNPLAPFFNELFPNPYVHVSFERLYAFYMRHYAGLAEHNWRDYLSFPRELTLTGTKLQGFLGPLFLLAPLGLWSLRQRLGRLVWIAAAVFALPWFSNIGTRFLIPSLMFVSLGMALAIQQTPRRVAALLAIVLAGGHALASWPALIGRWNHQPAWRLESIPWRAALRIEPEELYLARVLPGYNVARMIEQNARPRAKVFAPEGIAEAYTSREVLVSYQCALCEVLMDDLLTPVVADFGPVASIRFEWPPREVTGLRLVQTASDPWQMWSFHELLLFSGEDYRIPEPSWTIRARPNSRDGALAMDGNPATRWRSWWPLNPGMQYQVEFPEPLRLSVLELLCSGDQQQVALEVYARDKDGRWMPVRAAPTRADREAPREKMKKLATRELKRRGIEYILTDLAGEGMNLIAPHIARSPGAWGLREAGRYGSARLYEIE